MRPDRAAALYDLGLVLSVPAALAGTAVVVALVADETFALPGLALTVALSGGAGGAAIAVARRAPSREGGLTPPWVAAGWLLAVLLAAVPFLMIGAASAPGSVAADYADPVNALFESMSALTSTGLSVATDASALPHVLQWWRSVLQWVGGVGVLYLVLGMAHGGRSEETASDTETDVGDVPGWDGPAVRTVWTIYAGYTVAIVLAFWASGMRPWEALNHGLTTIATGGFTVTSDSFASYGPAIRVVGIVGMVAGGLSFALHAAALVTRRPAAVARDAQVRLLAALLVVGAAALWLVLGREEAALDTAFQWTSALTTSGFAVLDEGRWAPSALVLVTAVMLVGASAGSTVGGVKLKRVALLAHMAACRAAPLRVDGRPWGGVEDRREVARVALSLAAAFVVGTGLLAWTAGPAPLAELAFEAASALGTVGLSTGVTGPDLPAPARLVLTALMWVGRLEVVAVLALVASVVRRGEGA